MSDILDRLKTLDGIGNGTQEIIDDAIKEIERLRLTPVGRGPDGEPDAISLGELVDLRSEIEDLRDYQHHAEWSIRRWTHEYSELAASLEKARCEHQTK